MRTSMFQIFRSISTTTSPSCRLLVVVACVPSCFPLSKRHLCYLMHQLLLHCRGLRAWYNLVRSLANPQGPWEWYYNSYFEIALVQRWTRKIFFLTVTVLLPWLARHTCSKHARLASRPSRRSWWWTTSWWPPGRLGGESCRCSIYSRLQSVLRTSSFSIIMSFLFFLLIIRKMFHSFCYYYYYKMTKTA